MMLPVGNRVQTVAASKEEAIKVGSVYYEADACTACSGLPVLVEDRFARYTKTDRCVRCSINIAKWAYIVGEGMHDVVDNHVMNAFGKNVYPLTDEQEKEIGEVISALKGYDWVYGVPGDKVGPILPTQGLARRAGAKTYLKLGCGRDCGHIGHCYTATGKCVACDQARRNSPRILARRAGDTWYTPKSPCKKCETMSDRRVSDGRCKGCRPLNHAKVISPRKRAELNGEMWYSPDTDCPYCGTRAERRVANGQCKGCNPPKRAMVDADSLMLASPDLVLSRGDAKRLGFTVYRTGKPCVHGHTGFRYTSTGNCITCIKKAL